MEKISCILMFCGGVIIGLVIFPLVRLIKLDGINCILDSLAGLMASPFSRISKLLRGKEPPPPSRPKPREDTKSEVDTREKQIRDSAQAIREILISVANTIRHADKAATDSSQALGNVKGTMDQLELPEDLSQAQRIVLQGIDRVISSNLKLKNELASSQDILVEQKKQIEDLQTAVRIDALTQLANRAYFDEKLTESLNVLQRYNETFSLMMIDLDNFKDINDTYGHPAGDRILKGVAFKIRESLRSSDFLARFGGDEFALILIRANAEIASDVAWKLCENLRGSRFLLDDTQITMTLSIGVTEADTGDTEESLLKRADEALYRVKHTGRNNVLLAEKPAGIGTDNVRQFTRKAP